MKKLNKKGFTIVELVIVIAVIAILAAVLIPTFSGVVGRAQQSAALQTAKSTLSNALVMSSTAQLNGTTSDGVEKTVFVVDGYAFRYTGNQLESYTYPSGSNTLKKGATMEKNDPNNFNAILISSDNLIETTTYSYTVLNTAPTDWSTNYTSYYTASTGDNTTYTLVPSGDSAPEFAENTYYERTGTTSYVIAEDIYKVIDAVSNVTDITRTVTLIDDTYYLNYTSNENYDAKVFVNSDFSNKVVVFTTFG